MTTPMDTTDPETLRVVLVDDHPLIRRSLEKELIRRGMQVVGQGENGTDALRLVEQHRPHVIILDVSMPGPNVMDTVSRLRQQTPTTFILIYSGNSEEEKILALFEAGITGYLLKTEDPECLAAGVQTVAQGKTWLSPEISKVMVGLALGNKPKPTSPQPEQPLETSELTSREAEVLRLLAIGYNNDAIAKHLHISPNTLRNHLSQIYNKLGVESRADAVVWAWQKGMGNKK